MALRPALAGSLLLLAFLGAAGCGEASRPGEAGRSGEPARPAVPGMAAASGTAALPPEARFAGTETCAGCHAAEAEAWQGSHHDLAMQPANEATVRGDFAGAEFTHDDGTTRFFRRDGAFFVETEGPDGAPAEFEIVWTFGAEPLQQYLIELDDGRVQALTVAWDARPAEDGGQRWFDLYPDEVIAAADALHWTGVYQRWNTMCADCHSTALEKGYDADADRFETQFAAIDVGCEACHGPSGAHAENPAVPPRVSGLAARRWVIGEGQRIASRAATAAAPASSTGSGSTSDSTSGPTSNAPSQPPSQPPEIEICAQCHSRRAQLSDDYRAGDAMLDAYRPALLERGLYHADGQIEDEVYVYGSFLQSAMAAAGVTCSDCHDPHTARLRREGNELCSGCHLPAAYDTREHHRHEPGTAAGECASCHMRAETYMVVDPRRDHSFRVPRPDLSTALESPNACNDCHADQTSDWAAAQVAAWYPDGRWREPHFGLAIDAGRSWAADARRLLGTVIGDDAEPAIARATALGLLAERVTAADLATIEPMLDRDEALLQLAAVEASASFPPETRARLLQRFLTDDRRALRIAAGRALLTARAELSARRQADLDAAIAEYLEVQTFNSDRPEGLLNRASVAVEQGRFAEAEALYLEAVERHPAFAPLYINLADLYRLRGRAAEGEAILRTGLEAMPEAHDIRFALALALVRAARADEALPLFEAAAAGTPDDPYYAYVLAIALNDSGDTSRALEQLRMTHERFPGHGDTLFALATMLRDAGDIESAREYARRLTEVRPGDDAAIALLSELDQRL